MDLVLADLVRQSVAPGDRNLRGFAWDDLSPEVMNVYTVSKTGITFIFPPYVMASYAEGTLTATLPFAAFNGYLAHTNVTPLLRVESFTPPAPGAQDTTDALRLHMQTAWAAAALPKPQRDSYLQASNIIRKLAAAREGLRQAQAESYVWVQVYQLDNLEHGQTLAAIVQALRNPVADPAARERAHASLTAAEIQAKALLIPANTPVERTAYANYSRSLLYGLADLTLALPGWPDQVAEVVCGYVGKVMGPDTEAETE
jgi:hypothetical protein